MTKRIVVAIVEPPTLGNPFWIMTAPAISYSAQGRTRAEALGRFEETLDEAAEWASPDMLDHHGHGNG